MVQKSGYDDFGFIGRVYHLFNSIILLKKLEMSNQWFIERVCHLFNSIILLKKLEMSNQWF